MTDLIQRLTGAPQPVVVGGPGPSLPELRQRLTEIGYVFVKFTGTAGETDLGLRVDTAATDLSRADFTAGTGTAHLEGTLTLDFVPVRCVADIDLATLTGTAHLVIPEPATV